MKKHHITKADQTFIPLCVHYWKDILDSTRKLENTRLKRCVSKIIKIVN
jgi:hypothetical protein